MRPSPLRIALIVLPFVGALVAGDLLKAWREVSPTETAASENGVSVKVVPVRVKAEAPGLPDSHLDGVRYADNRSPSSSPAASGDDASEPGRSRTGSLTEALGEPRRVRIIAVRPDATASPPAKPPTRADAAPGETPGHENDARAILSEMRIKYGPVVGQPETVPQAEADGTVLYHVRVGPFARDDAERLCNVLRGAAPVRRRGSDLGADRFLAGVVSRAESAFHGNRYPFRPCALRTKQVRNASARAH